MVNSVHHNVMLFRYTFTSISGSLSNVYGYELVLVVRLLGISYLVAEHGIHQGICND